MPRKDNAGKANGGKANIGKTSGGEDLTGFEAAMAALRPRTDRLDPTWGSLLAKEVSLNAAIRLERPAAPRGRMPPCNHPAGHRFMCVHCGSDAPPVSRAHRWAWPSALATVTSIAAILLVMLVADRHGQLAERDSKSVASNATAAGRADNPFAETPESADETRAALAPNRVAALPHKAGAMNDRDIWLLLAASKQRDGRAVLSAGDMRRAVQLPLFNGLFSTN